MYCQAFALGPICYQLDDVAIRAITSIWQKRQVIVQIQKSHSLVKTIATTKWTRLRQLATKSIISWSLLTASQHMTTNI